MIEATDGEQAWKILTESPMPNLTILDWLLKNEANLEGGLKNASRLEKLKQVYDSLSNLHHLTKLNST